jgi:hypothetical protein
MSLYNFFENSCLDNKNISLCASEWRPLIAYSVNNIVTLCNTVWICISESVNNIPFIGSSYWRLISVSCKTVQCEPKPCYNSQPCEYVVPENIGYNSHRRRCECSKKKCGC